MKTNGQFYHPQVKPNSRWRAGTEPRLLDESNNANQVVIYFADAPDGLFRDEHFAPLSRRHAIMLFEEGLERGQLKRKFYKMTAAPIDEEEVKVKREKRAQRRAERKATTDSLPPAKKSSEQPAEKSSKGIVDAIQRAVTAQAQGKSKEAIKFVKQARDMKGKTRKDRLALRELEKKLGVRK